MKNNPLLEQSLNFATKIKTLQYILLKEKKESVISKQIIRSATSIGANINEAIMQIVNLILYQNYIYL